MYLFNTSKELTEYIASQYPKTRVSLACFMIGTDDKIGMTGIYDKDKLIGGFLFYIDRAINKWVLANSDDAKLAVMYYIEYNEKLDNAIIEIENSIADGTASMYGVNIMLDGSLGIDID